MTVQLLMKTFLELDGAQVGSGFHHPEHPDPDLAQITQEFFSRFPFLKKDQGYVDFMETYAGAFLYVPGENLSIDLFGLSDVSTHLIEGEGELIDDDGFLAICDICVPINEKTGASGDSIGFGFSFDTTLSRRWGIYRHLPNKPPELYCGTFIELLTKLIAKKGRLFD